MRDLKIATGVFVDRDEELDALRSLVPPACLDSSILVIKAPPGFGKSTLTTRLIDWLSAAGVDIPIAVVDPSIRLKSGDARIYNGFFIQRLAEDLSAQFEGSYESFESFLGERRWQTAGEKSISDLVRQYPSLSTLYGDAVDYLDRLLSRGEFAAEKILASDSNVAVGLCIDYIENVCRSKALVTIVRDAQHIDHQSLRLFLQMNSELPMQHLFMEYTCLNDEFDPAHEKLILRAFEKHMNAHTLGLPALDRVNLERLIRRAVKSDFSVTPDHYSKWNGNLRSVMELKYRMSIRRRSDNDAELALSLTDFLGELNSHLGQLNRQQQLLLAILVSHIEAIDRRTLIAAAASIDRYAPLAVWNETLAELQKVHLFIEVNNGAVRIQHEDIAAAFQARPESAGLLSLAQRALRDFYTQIVFTADFRLASLPIAVRQALSLCAQTRDTTLLIRVMNRITEEIRQANDQSIYVDAVLGAITDNDQLFAMERTALVDWAAALAYDTCDFKRAVGVLDLMPDVDAYRGTMLACARLEAGMQQAALDIVRTYRSVWPGTDTQLALDLVELFVYRDLGNIRRAREMLDSITSDPARAESPLFGYALRFSQSLNEQPKSTVDALASIEWFARFGLLQSRAYSQLAASMNLAREGRTEEARGLIDSAAQQLAAEVRDQHLILNNRSAVMMLSELPDFDACIEWLTHGMRTSRDDFSDTILLNNLAIAHWRSERMSEAVECVERMLAILNAPTFAESDIFWGTGFTAISIFTRAGLSDRADQVRAIQRRPPVVNRAYWDYRYGLSRDFRPQFSFLARFDYHPLFLSHWSIDREGLELLRE